MIYNLNTDKRFISRILVALGVVAVLVLWLLKELPATAGMFGWYSVAWAATIFAGVVGLKFLLDGIFMGSKGVISRKLLILLGTACLVVAFIALTFAIVIPNNIVLPIIAIALAGAIFLGILVTGGRKWDGADNQRVGYKNYHQRKAEEEKAEKKAGQK